MDFTNFWFPKKAGGGDPGDPIGQSLRFRGAQYLEGPTLGSTNVYTISTWFKLQTLNSAGDQQILFSPSNTGSYFVIYDGDQATYPGIPRYWINSAVSWDGNITKKSYRDPSAWYHLIFQVSSAGTKVFFNGEQDPTVGSQVSINMAPFRIGTNNTKSATFRMHGYMADFHFVDGQALDPTTFGRYNANGVWVPVDPEKDGDTAWYGANGFHLTFADPTDVGKDYSGNGNDFTPTGFDTTSFVSGYWVDAVTAAVGGEIPNGGTPYCIDIEPATVTLGYPNNAVGPGTAGNTADVIFDGKLDTWLYWGSSAYASGNVDQFRVDLRDFTADGITKVECFCSRGVGLSAGSYTPYNYQLLDASKVAIAGSSAQPTNSDNGQWLDIPVSGTPRYLEISSSVDSRRNVLYAIRINGQILSQEATAAPTFDLMQDSPTQNYATYNPLLPFNNQSSLFDANLQMQANINQVNQLLPKATHRLEPGMKVYCEYEITKTNGTSPSWNIGLSSLEGLVTSDPKRLGRNPDQVGIYDTSRVYVDNVAQNITIPTANQIGAALGSYYMMAIDYDNGNIWYGANGEWWNWDGAAWNFSTTFESTQPTLSGLDISRMPFITGQQAYLAGALQSAINFGQQPFQHTPPAGFEKLQTANMPAATIPDGRDHFQAITDTGNSPATFYNEGSITDVQSSVVLTTPVPLGVQENANSFAIDLGSSVVTANVTWGTTWSSAVSIWCSNDGTTWTDTGQSGATAGIRNTYSISGNPFRYVRAYLGSSYGNSLTSAGPSILAAAQAAFPSALWWVKDRVNANQHQLVDSVRNDNVAILSPASSVSTQVATYAAPTGDSVAWCWNYNANNPSQNGFDIVTYTGNYDTQGDTTRNIAHQLGKTPEMIICTSRGNDVVLSYAANVAHVALTYGDTPAEQFNMDLRTVDAAQDGYNYWGSGTVFLGDANNFSLVPGRYDNAQKNEQDKEYIAYLWTSVPGYSAFGSYTGNGNAYGPFVYTGFRPAWVMCKSSNATSNWTILDSTRDIDNPADQRLFANTDGTEVANGDGNTDFLSNGFKLRHAGGAANNSGEIYIYAAFAENPFSSPTTAR